jgi:Flp pilus assembly protein TadD
VALNLEHRWTEAARELEAAVRLNPLDAAPHIALAVAEANSGHVPAARLQAREALQLDPDSKRARQLLELLK